MVMTAGLRRALKGLSEAAFRERFGSEEACRKALFEMRWRQGLTCPACGHKRFCQLKTRELFQCNRCKRQVRLTAGTVFQDTKLPLTTWFIAIYHLTQSKNGISSIELGRRLGVKRQTAWLMKHKLMRAMGAREAHKPKLEGRVEVDDAYLGGERPGGKRGRGAAGKQPFVAAVETTPERRPKRLRLSVVKGFRKKEIERLAKVPSGTRQRDRQRRSVLLARGREGRLLASPDGHGLGQAGRALDPVPVGEHDAGQHQDRDRRHLPSHQRQARPIVPHQLRLPLQPTLPARQHRRAPRLGRRPHQPAALPRCHCGCVKRTIR